MVKRSFDVFLSAVGLVILSPVLVAVCLAIWLQDFHSPFYVARRVGRSKAQFRIVKLRSMVVNADKTGVSSTAGDDRRITAAGRFVRRYKIDELVQLWNVFKGDMSLVGPRPQVIEGGVDRYTQEEMRILGVRPGITDLASIVFSDEADILRGSSDPDSLYDQIIRPWKSRLALWYIDHRSLQLDMELILTTIVAIASRPLALKRVESILRRADVDDRLIRVASRTEPLYAFPPPGKDAGVPSTRELTGAANH